MSEPEVLIELRALGADPDRPESVDPAEQDFAGTVLQVLDSIDGLEVGDSVMGWFRRETLTVGREVRVPAAQVLQKPEGIEWAVAGGLRAAAEAAWDAVRAVGPHPIMAVGVSDADTLTGLIAAQLLQATRSHAVGLTASAHATWLSSRGVRVADKEGDPIAGLRASAPHGLAAFLDLGGAVDAHTATSLGVDPDQLYNARGGATRQVRDAHGPTRPTGTTNVLDRVSGLVAAGLIEVPIAVVHPIEDPRDRAMSMEPIGLGVRTFLLT